MGDGARDPGAAEVGVRPSEQRSTGGAPSQWSRGHAARRPARRKCLAPRGRNRRVRGLLQLDALNVQPSLAGESPLASLPADLTRPAAGQAPRQPNTLQTSL